MRFLMLLLLTLLIVTNSFEIITRTSSPLRNRNSDQLNGANLKFVFFHVPPFVVMSTGPDGNYTVTGSNSRIISWLAQKLNFTVSYVLIPNEMTKSKYGNKSDVAVTFNLIAEREIDVSSVGFIPTPERKKLVDFAYFLSAEPHAMVVPRPGEEPRLFAFIRPFQSSVWLLILIVSILVIASMCLFSKVYSKLLINEREVSDTTALEWAGQYSIYIVNILTNQGNRVLVTRLSFQVLVGTWLLVAMVLVNSYSGTVISCLTVPKMKPSINNLEDLASSEDVKLVLLADTVIAQHIRESKSGASKILGDQIRNNPDRISSSLSDVNSRMETERYAFPFLQTVSNDYVASDFKKTGKCRFQTTDPITSFQFWCLILQKNNKFTPAINNAMIQLWETGLPPFWIKKTISSAPKCFAKAKPRTSSRQVPIRLEDLTGAFFVLGIGFCLTLLAFLAEKILYLRSRRRARPSALNSLNQAVHNSIVVNPN